MFRNSSFSKIYIKMPLRLVFLFMGFLSTVWFLIRVIPKPSRASYPCMQANAPLMSGFITYMLGLVGSTLFLKKAPRRHSTNGKYAIAIASIAVCAVFMSLSNNELPIYANSTPLLGPNQPIGEGYGIFPGRVVWVWNPDATNENCSNLFGDGWFLPQNTNLTVVTDMVTVAVKNVSGQETISESWDALFRSFNKRHDKGDIGYAAGEKIFIKVNLVSASSNTIAEDYTILNSNRYGMAETSPQLVLAILRQLVNDYGIPAENIAVGDPMKHIYKHVYDMWHSEFPDLTFIDHRGEYGRTKPIPHTQQSIFYSDHGQVLKESSGTPVTDFLPAAMVQAQYMINIAALKGHARAGITLCAKNHFGSNTRSGASHLHEGLVSPNKTLTRPGYGLYRVQVDLMGHELLGGNTMLFVVDGLWGGSEANDPPRKFQMPPFNNDWSSSIFLSQDQVALESVCFDFLRSEFTESNPFGSYPQYEGTDDYLLQAADSSYWPENLQYDPENNGSVLGSLGVHESWNNVDSKQYSRNLGYNNGIELVYIDNAVTGIKNQLGDQVRAFTLYAGYPNPFNGLTTISYRLDELGNVQLDIYNALGQKIRTLLSEIQSEGMHRVTWDGSDERGLTVPSGLYLTHLKTGTEQAISKLLYLK